MTVSGRMARASAYKSVPASAGMGMKTSSNGTAARARPRPLPPRAAARQAGRGRPVFLADACHRGAKYSGPDSTLLQRSEPTVHGQGRPCDVGGRGRREE
jgi:hypothetical protein